MIFSRSRAKANDTNEGYRAVEAETIKRWQNIAAKNDQGDSYHLGEDAKQETKQEEKCVNIQLPSSPSTITLTDAEVVADKPEPEETEEPLTVSKILPCDLNLPAEEDIKRRFGTNIRSALGAGTVIEGTFRFDSPVCIDGTLTGEVCSNSALIVGDQATVNAQIQVGSLIVLGQVCGDVEASDLVEIRAGGSLKGDIIARRLVMEDGSLFHGSCNTLD